MTFENWYEFNCFFTVLFILFKAIRRPILEGNPPEFVHVFLLSFPNFCEAVIGTLLLTAIGLYFNKKLKLNNKTVYILATIFAGVYVITQEMKFHNIGGNNVYDPYDVLFSTIGLVFGFIIIYRMKPTINTATS